MRFENDAESRALQTLTRDIGAADLFAECLEYDLSSLSAFMAVEHAEADKKFYCHKDLSVA
jgi:hypothetical protein